MLEHCKWDPQVGDQATLASFPVFISTREWGGLASRAEQLARETVTSEQELRESKRARRALRLPRELARVFDAAADFPASRGVARVMRFDFHFTGDGWRLSEVNSDVPGGYCEAEGFTTLMAEGFSDCLVPGRPASAWADAVLEGLGSDGSGVVGLLSAPGYVEDAQVVSYLAARLRARGVATRLLGPGQIRWESRRAFPHEAREPFAALLRFYQIEWLAQTSPATGWPHFISNGLTLVSNVGCAALSETKRFPLSWPHLRTAVPAWRAALSETRAVHDVAFDSNDEWTLKGSYSNCGDALIARPWVSAWRWRGAWARALLEPSAWVAQRRFEVLPMDSPLGPLRHCLGVYVVNGRAAGAYLRLTKRPFIDFQAIDAALLVTDAHEDAS